MVNLLVIFVIQPLLVGSINISVKISNMEQPQDCQDFWDRFEVKPIKNRPSFIILLIHYYHRIKQTMYNYCENQIIYKLF